MFLKFLVFAILGFSLAADPLYESSGFHCKSKLSMRLDRRLHGEPRDAPPPFDVQVLDEEGHQTEYYEPGKIYTIRLIGYQYYRGLLLQPRLCDEHGFVIGSLRGGRFLETPDWIQYGIRLQECDMKYPLEDSVTHADDSRKFVTQIQWTSGRDVGNVQFMFTILSENDVYWERWRPQSGFLQPIYSKQFPSEVLRQVFYNEKYALKFLAGKFTSSQESKMPSSKEEMPKLEEILIATEKPEMPMEAKKVLEKMEKPEFWSHHDGEVKINKNEKIDILETKEKKEGETDFISDNKNSGEAKVNEEMIEEITESDEERVEEIPFIGGMIEGNSETSPHIPDHESITHSPEAVKESESQKEASIDSGEATVQPAEPETLKDEKPLKPAFEEAFSHDDIETKEIEVTMAPEEIIPESTTAAIEATETTLLVDETETSTAPEVEETSTLSEEIPTELSTEATTLISEAEITTSVTEITDNKQDTVTEKPSVESVVNENGVEEILPKSIELTSESTTIQAEEIQTVEQEVTTIASDAEDETTVASTDAENSADESSPSPEQNVVVEDSVKDETATNNDQNDETTEPANESEATPSESNDNVDETTTTESTPDAEETTTLEFDAETQTPTAEEEMKEIENDLSHVSEIPEANAESTQTEASEIETTSEASTDDEMTEKTEATTEESITESVPEEPTDSTMNDESTTAEIEEDTTEMPMEETTENTETETEEPTTEEPMTSEISETSETETTNETQEETTEAAVEEITENPNTKEDEATTVPKEDENEMTTVTPKEESETTINAETEETTAETTTANVEEASTAEPETTTVASEEVTTEKITEASTVEITTVALQDTVNQTTAIEASTPTFDELITTLPTHDETSSNSVDLESTSETPSHPKDISRRRR